MKNETTFKEGNNWRFTKDCQPKRCMTSKQMLKAIDNILNMSFDEIDTLVTNNRAPLFLRLAAQRVQDGDLDYVVALRKEYATSLIYPQKGN